MSTFIGKKTKNTDNFNKPFKKKKYDTPYPVTLTMSEVEVTPNIKAQLMKNELGKFIDFRRYIGNKPTKTGIRMPIKPFLTSVNKLTKDMKDLVDDEK
jgi:hypothetical protein